jgi:hypothetical protein
LARLRPGGRRACNGTVFRAVFQHKELATDDPTHDHEIYRSGKYVRFYKLRSKNLPSGTFLRGSDALRAHSSRFAHWLNPADLYASLRYGSSAQRLPFTATPDRAFIHCGVEHRLEETKDNLERQEIGDRKPAESTPPPPRVSGHSHSIVLEHRNALIFIRKTFLQTA